MTHTTLDFIYGHDKVIVDLLAHGGVKFVRGVGPNKVSDPGRGRLQGAIRATPDKVEVTRDFALLHFAQVERVDVRLDEAYKSWERLTLAIDDLVQRVLRILIFHVPAYESFVRQRRGRKAVLHHAPLLAAVVVAVAKSVR